MTANTFGRFQEHGLTMTRFEQHVAEHWRGYDLRTALAVAGVDGPIDPHVLRATRAIANIALGLSGEAGESAEHFKKFMRPGCNIDRRAAAMELGDTLYYLTACAVALGFSLQDVAELNMEKLDERRAAAAAAAK